MAKHRQTHQAHDPAVRKATEIFGGSQSDDWNNVLVNQAVQSLWMKNSDNEGINADTRPFSRA